MRYRVTLQFVVDADEGDAWDIAEGLERAAMKRDGYTEISGFVNPVDGRSAALGLEGAGIASSAETIERRSQVGAPTGFGGPDGLDMITLGGEDGRMG